MVISKNALALIILVAIPIAASAQAAGDAPVKPGVKLWEWEKGFAVESLKQPDMTVYLWFYEWNMFDARQKGMHTGGSYKWDRALSEDQQQAMITTPDMQLDLQATDDGAELTLTVTNKTDHAWPAIAGIIPCFNPGTPKGQTDRFPLAKLNPQFDNQKTWFVGSDGLQKLEGRAIHFNRQLRKQVDRAGKNGQYVFSHKWPTSDDNAHGGLMIRESTNGKWVAGIAWEQFLSAQGHNPWQCMHLCINVGPLEVGKSKKIKGRIYLFEGTREDGLAKYKRDFSVK